MLEDLYKLYHSLGGQEDCRCFTVYDLWCEIAKLEGIDISNVTNINEVLEKINQSV